MRYDYIEEIDKFNPYHGADGRFTSANAASSFTWKPGASAAHDAAIAREKINSNPYRHKKTDALYDELSKLQGEHVKALRWARSSTDGETPAVKRKIDGARKKAATLQTKIKQVSEMLDYNEKYGDPNADVPF
ncbi:MAG: hypothetical protein Q4C56_03990 [Peptococcaceae bacterium]|nr:hypothetical protein [Peptococcaceae bacterium]